MNTKRFDDQFVTIDVTPAGQDDSRKRPFFTALGRAVFNLAALAVVLAFLFAILAVALIALPFAILALAVGAWIAARSARRFGEAGGDARGWTIVSIRPNPFGGAR